MKMERMRFWVASAVLFCSLCAFAEGGAAKELQGTVQEGGFGKFRIEEKGGTSWLFYLSKDSTTYKPDDWRPIVGDEVSVASMEVKKRVATILQATSVSLVKAGPNTPRIQSPVAVQITEVGRSGYKAKILSSGVIVKFSKQRGTKVAPAGWAPAVGEKALVTFTVKPAMGFGIAYAADKLERQDAGGK